jgi:thioesterase domain-containing protein
VGLSISILFESGTPEALARVIDEASKERQTRVLLPVQTSGDGPVIFCVHGTDGESLFPHRFMEAFKQDRPISGFRAFGLEPGETPPATIEAMAEIYLTALRAAQPKGPYVVLGHCAGAVTAWEMVRRLVAEGDRVAGMILIDPPSHVDVAPYLHKSGLELGIFQAQSLRRAAARAATIDPDAIDADGRRDLVRSAFSQALAYYVPKALDCPTLLLCSQERKPALLNPERGYRLLLSNPTCVEFSGNHMAVFDRHLHEVAAEIRQFLDLNAPVPGAAAADAAARAG